MAGPNPLDLSEIRNILARLFTRRPWITSLSPLFPVAWTMAGPNPLDLPEIRNILALFFTHHELTICCRVSRDWRSTFEPHIWRNIKILSEDLVQSKAMTKAGLKGHSDFIERLACVGDGEYLRDLTCRHINVLYLSWRCPFQRDFTFRHRTTVRRLSLNLYDSKDEIWGLVLSCPALESLSLKHVHITEPDLPSFKSLWARLRCLHLSLFEFRVGDLVRAGSHNRAKTVSFLKELPPSAIRDLKLANIRGLSTEEPLIFLRACPLLETLTWCPNINSQDVDFHLGNDGSHLAEQAQHCPKLVNLTAKNQEREQRGVLLFLRSRTQLPLEQLSVPFNSFSEISWALLKEHHLSSLRLLNLQGCSISGKVVQDILCSIPKLETLVVPWLRDSDIDVRPWICTGLKRLTVCINLTKKASQRMIFLRLSKLTQLRYLDLTKNHTRLFDRRLRAKVITHLKFAVKHGLGLLKTLVNLEQLCLSEPGQLLKEEDVKWMLENWPQLRSVDGYLAKNKRLHRELTELLRQGGVGTLFPEGRRKLYTDGGVGGVPDPRVWVSDATE